MVNTQSSKVKLEEIGKFEVPTTEEIKQEDVKVTNLFEKVMGSINPFSQYIIREMRDPVGQSDVKLWELEESIFNKPLGEVKRESLFRSSSEMFVIYKYTNDPLMLVKSDRYTEGKFVPVRALFPKEESLIFETSILQQMKLKEMQLQQQKNMLNALNQMQPPPTTV